MRNVIILGSGRSGTSMTAGALAAAGYFMGHHPTNGRINNPFGNFEDHGVNGVNERLLEQVVPQPGMVDGVLRHLDRPREGQRWLARLPVTTTVSPLMEIIPTIQELTSRQPYCFKDPRFSYTLPVWRPYLENTVFVCVFREPYKTVQSILKQSQDAPHLQGLDMTSETALDVWCLMYRHILEVHRHSGQWIFLHYDQLISGEGVRRLAQTTGASLAGTFPKPELKKRYIFTPVTETAARIYADLCMLANFDASGE